jgi:hypothetical protein
MDPDIRIGKDKLLFSIQNNPEWTVFNTSTGELKGQPDTSDVDHVEGIIITVTDSQGGSDSLQPFDIVVALNEPKNTTDVDLSESSAKQAEITDEQDKSDVSSYDIVVNESAVDPSIQNPIIVKEIIKGSLQPRTSIPNYVNTESTVTGSRVSDEDASEATSDADNQDLLERQVELKESGGVQTNRPSIATPEPTATQSNTAPKVSDQKSSEVVPDTDNKDLLNSQIETKDSDRGKISRPSIETREQTATQSNTAPKVSDQKSSEAADTDKPNNIIGSLVNTIVNIFTQPSQDSVKNHNSQTNREFTNLDNKPVDDKVNSSANLSDSSDAGTVSSQVQTSSVAPKSVVERRNNEVDGQLRELEEITPVIGNGNQNLSTSDNKQNNGSQSSNGSKKGNNSTSLGTDSNAASIPSDSDASKPSIDKVTDSGVSKDTKDEGNSDKSTSNQSDDNTNLELKEIVNLKNSELDNGVDAKEAKDNPQFTEKDKAPATPAKESKELKNSDMAAKKDDESKASTAKKSNEDLADPKKGKAKGDPEETDKGAEKVESLKANEEVQDTEADNGTKLDVTTENKDGTGSKDTKDKIVTEPSSGNPDNSLSGDNAKASKGKEDAVKNSDDANDQNKGDKDTKDTTDKSQSKEDKVPATPANESQETKNSDMSAKQDDESKASTAKKSNEDLADPKKDKVKGDPEETDKGAEKVESLKASEEVQDTEADNGTKLDVTTENKDGAGSKDTKDKIVTEPSSGNPDNSLSDGNAKASKGKEDAVKNSDDANDQTKGDKDTKDTTDKSQSKEDKVPATPANESQETKNSDMSAKQDDESKASTAKKSNEDLADPKKGKAKGNPEETDKGAEKVESLKANEEVQDTEADNGTKLDVTTENKDGTGSKDTKDKIVTEPSSGNPDNSLSDGNAKASKGKDDAVKVSVEANDQNKGDKDTKDTKDTKTLKAIKAIKTLKAIHSLKKTKRQQLLLRKARRLKTKNLSNQIVTSQMLKLI